MRRPRKPRLIAITAGDPCGIGCEIILKSLHRIRTPPEVHLLVIGDLAVFKEAARRLRRKLPPWQVVSAAALPAGTCSARLAFCDLNHPYRFVPGDSSFRAGQASLDYLDVALGLWRAGRLQGLVTAPVTKWAVQKSNRRFVGHTEYLAHHTKTKNVVMLFASPRMRVAVVTRHIPLRAVSVALTAALLSSTIRLTATALRKQFGIAHPRLALCGLNPHAAEGARQASEEKRVMLPVLRKLRKSGITCAGPFAADGFFTGTHRAFDAILCPYHDQGLIPFKMASRDTGCQVSLGLPFVRTSPDHGSGLGIAGRSQAHPGSMRYALRLAIDTVSRKQ